MVLEQNYQLLMTYFNNSDPKKHGGLKLRMRARITRWRMPKFKALRSVKYVTYPNDIKVDNKVDLTNFFPKKPRYGYNYLKTVVLKNHQIRRINMK